MKNLPSEFIAGNLFQNVMPIYNRFLARSSRGTIKMDAPFNDLNSYFRKLFGCRVHKISLDAGMTCPNRDGKISHGGCIYCNAKGSGTGSFQQGLSITHQIENSKAGLIKRFKAKKFIAYFQSYTNTYAPIEKLKSIWEEALACKDVVGLSIGTRPDCIDSAILSLLQSYAADHLIWIEYGLQSVHNKTLSAINRGHDVECFYRAVEATRDRNIKICAHVILGLPGESKPEMLEAARVLGELKLDGVKLHLLYVVKGTPMEKLYASGAYTCLTQSRYVELVCDFLELLPPEMIIHRLTGDPHPLELIAPLWALQKPETLSRIKETLSLRNSRQGHFYRPK